MDMRQLDHFIKVAEIENISKAAETLYISQSTLSRLIKQLEEELGCQLFRRQGKNIFLTESGRTFYQSAHEMLRTLQNTKDRLKGLTRDGVETVKVQLRCIPAVFFPVLKEFMAQEETVHFQVLQSDNQGIEQDRYDFLISPVQEPVLTASSRPILREEVFLALSAADPLTLKPHLRPADLKGRQYVSVAKNRFFYETTLTHLKRMGCGENCRLYCDDMGTMRNLVRSSGCITHIPRYTCSQEDLQGIVLRRVEGFPLFRYASMTSSAEAALNETAQRFREYFLRSLETRGLLYDPQLGEN